MLRNDCTRNCWTAAGLIGLAIALAAGLGGVGVMAALFLGFVGFWLIGGLLVWLLCAGRVESARLVEVAPMAVRPAPPSEQHAGERALIAPVSILAPAQPLAGQETGAIVARPGAAQAPTFGVIAPAVVPALAAAPVAAMPAMTVASDELPEPDMAAALPAPQVDAIRTGKPDKAKSKSGKISAKDDKKDDKAARRARKAEKARKRGEAEALASALLNTRAHETRDDLGRIDGIGPKLTQWLNAQGIWRFEQIAAWTPAEAADWAQRLGKLGGRIAGNDWIGQARILAAGGETSHSRRFDDGKTT